MAHLVHYSPSRTAETAPCGRRIRGRSAVSTMPRPSWSRFQVNCQKCRAHNRREAYRRALARMGGFKWAI